MKIDSIKIENYNPIRNIEINNMGDVVIIAGANGSGKTRLKDAIVATIQGNPQATLDIVGTRKKEIEDFGESKITINQGVQNPTFNEYISSRRWGIGKYVGSLVQIDSKRDVQTLKFNKLHYITEDPDESETPTNFYYRNFYDRWQDFMNYIHQKVAAHDRKFSIEAHNVDRDITVGEVIDKFPHPLEKYKELFSTLLPGKELLDIDPANPREFNFKDVNGVTLPFNALSSGEQEVVKVVFDVFRKEIRHSVVIVDEPELHLHPTLAFKLVETLKTVGDHTNQFIFLTHSADLISTYYSTGNVYFIDTNQDGANQAHKLSDLNHSHQELVQVIGENLGLFAVGKKLIFVEGENSSIDRQTYQSIVQKLNVDAKVIPIGSVDNIGTLKSLEEQIRSAIFGINFYLIRDRDGLSDDQIIDLETNGKLKCLKKRHIENYFLNSTYLLKTAEKLYIKESKPELTESYIEEKLKEIATNTIKQNIVHNTKDYLRLNNSFEIPKVKDLDNKSVEDIKSELVTNLNTSIYVLQNKLESVKFKNFLDETEKQVVDDLANGNWKNTFHGKIIFSIFCAEVLKTEKIKVRSAYTDIVLNENPLIFEDIIDIVNSFK